LSVGTSVLSPSTALDCPWGLALDATGTLRHLYAGAAALSVVEVAPPSPGTDASTT
jgi:hypothetical protein